MFNVFVWIIYVLCVVLDFQQEVDGLIEQEKGQSRSVIIDCGLQYSTRHDHYSLGTTKKGIGPMYSRLYCY